MCTLCGRGSTFNFPSSSPWTTMWSKIFLSVLVFHLTSAKSHGPQYVLIVPAVLQSISPQRLCVQLYNLSEPLSLNVHLEYHGINTTLFEESVTENNFFQCREFKASLATSDPLAFIIFSAKGHTVHLSERRSVAIQNVDSVVFIQTDKPIYKPGQTVMFRVVSLDNNFKPVQETYPLIILQDPHRNRIFQWLDVTSKNAIVQLSFPLIQEPILGSYEIIVEKKSGDKTLHWFTVEEYVLPKFKVTINAPKRVFFLDQELKVNVCAVYTYGQPVQGRVQLSVCRKHYSNKCNETPKGFCEAVTAQLGKDGCIMKVINTKTFKLYHPRMFWFLEVEAILTEDGTGVQIIGTDYISIYQARERIWFANMDTYYKRGIPYYGEIQMTNEDGIPVANEIIKLELNEKHVADYITNENGTARFSIDTSEFFEPSFKLRATYAVDDCRDLVWMDTYIPETTYYIQRFYSRTNSFVKLEHVLERLSCGQQGRIMVHYILNKEGYKDATSVNFYYVVMAKGIIVLNGQQQVSITGDPYGTFFISLTGSEQLAPSAQILVYTVHPGGELVADSTRLQIENCFKNKVQLQFSKKQGLPASNISLHLEAATNSYCALRAVDQSVLLLRPEQELSADFIYNQLHVRGYYGYYYKGLNLEDDDKEPCIPVTDTFFNGLYYVPVNVTRDGDVFGVFRNMGLKVFTNSTIRKPVLCPSDKLCLKEFTTHYGFSGGSAEKDGRTTMSESYVIKTVRKFFPETWIWDLVQIDSNGKASVSFTIPDTITEWKANAFCLEEEAGFGISSSTSLTAFQPFFVDMTLPYSIVRGEKFNLIANVFNYLNKCIEVSTVLEESRDYKIEPLSLEGNTARVCANERKTSSWTIIPQKLGNVSFTVTAETKLSDASREPGIERVDTVMQLLLVEPEGIKKEVTQSSLICTKGRTVSEMVSPKLPANLVQGSARASFSVLGDLLGMAMRNMGNLLRMPYGCGEQNMVLFAPNIYILDYLNKTGQLTKEIESKGVGYLASGYQKQLSYKHPDGSYSSFGTRDEEGSIWLTAFVYKSFSQSKRYIYIDDNVQTQTLIWLASKQKPDGCFQNVGNHFNNALEGGAEDGISLTAYVTAALLEAGLPSSHTVVQNGLSCLDTASVGNVDNVYYQALLAYAYGLAGNKEKWRFFLKELEKSATEVGGSVHWERKDKPLAEKFPSFNSRAASAEIEMTCYVILALLQRPTLTQEELSYVAQIVQWVAKQQNPYGGFSSTQDTVVALQALAQYGYLTFSKDGKNTVEISSKELPKKVFQVDNRNRLLLQQVSLPSLPGNYRMEVKGSGCVYLQTTLRYNIYLPQKASGFSLSVKTVNVSCTGSFLPKFDLVLSASYAGKRSTSNMAIIDVKMLSGFVPVRSSLQKLQDDRKVMQVDTRNNHIFFYLANVSQEEISFSFLVEQNLPVSDIKPASVHLYDYYETDEYALAEYNTPCSQASSENLLGVRERRNDRCENVMLDPHCSE
ncbi:ovostatin-like [Gopherus flavomarginatus]|uniref:ovostatin-like n=1 Tax=Gopherus flavomarginatus TaxID=286002 RepID=UPI0021CBB19F|nr:ovostatin-like [Gopherus flavomarginatus]